MATSVACADDDDTTGGNVCDDMETEYDAYSAGLTKIGDEGRVKIRIMDADPAPPHRGGNSWMFQLVDMADQPLPNATITSVKPFMPDHGHGTSVQAGYWRHRQQRRGCGRRHRLYDARRMDCHRRSRQRGLNRLGHFRLLHRWLMRGAGLLVGGHTALPRPGLSRPGLSRPGLSLRRSMRGLLAVSVSLSLLAACGDEDSCVVVPEANCAPLYQPTFDNVFSKTLVPTCGANGSACHAPQGAKGGLVFADIDDSYAALTEASGMGVRVLAGDASCSPLMGRLAAEDEAQAMPPGQRLSDAELCAISSWIADGAQR